MEDTELKANSNKNIEFQNDKGSFPETILLVEDDSAHAQLIGRALNKINSKVIHRSCVEDALTELTNSPIDLILTDLNLVSSSGFELISRLSLIAPDLPIIVLTSSSHVEDAVKAMREGAWDYIVKHFAGNFSAHLELVIGRTWERARQKIIEKETQTERNAFWMAASIAEDALAILNSEGQLLYHNSSFSRFLDVLRDNRKIDKKNIDNIVSLIALHDFRISQNLFSQIIVNNDSLWRSQLKVSKSNSVNEYSYFNLRLSTIITENSYSEDPDYEKNELDNNEFRYHILWVKDTTKAKQSEELERNLLATTTHDLRGPLSAILTSTDIILDDYEEELAKKLITRIASCAKTSMNIVDQLLSARTIEDGLMQLACKEIDIKDLINEIYKDYESVAKSRSIGFNYICPESSVIMYADPLAIKRIINNLLSNAFKFTLSNGEVTIELDSTKDGVIIKIIDNGVGIPPETQNILFEMFGRIPEHSHIEGTGLGLYITKKLVDLHQGIIELISSPGSGSTFSIYLPNQNK